jgi:hypothetical protein
MRQAQYNSPSRTRANWRAIIFTWLIVSLIWLGGVRVLRPPVGSQVDDHIFWIYLLAGPVATAIVLILLHSIDRDLFSSAKRVAPIGAVFVAIFALFGYLISAERECRSKFLERQLDSCTDIAEAVGTLATVGDKSLWNSAHDKFWAYYFGRLGVFENDLLEKRMVQFGDLLTTGYNLREPALCVAHTCRGQAQASWSVVPGLIRADLGPDEHCDGMDESMDKTFAQFCREFNNKPTYHPECQGMYAK